MTRHAALALLLLAACVHLPNRQPDPTTDEGEWGEARAAATRRATLFDGLDQKASASATWLSPEVREARARRQGAWQAWTPAEVEAAVAREKADADADQFLLALYTNDRKASDLEAKGSIWRVEAVWDGQPVRAAKVEVAEVDATQRQLFPYIGVFDVVYLIRVPHPAGVAGQPVLRLSSALGRLELDFGPGGRDSGWPHQFP